MSDEKKVGLLEKQMTRRQFLKISGKSIAGLTVSATMLSLFGCTQQEVDQGEVMMWAMPQGLLVVNAARCTGCQRCEINCTLANDGVCSTYISRVKIGRNLHIHGNDGLLNRNFVYFPDTCRQCKEPACGKTKRTANSPVMRISPTTSRFMPSASAAPKKSRWVSVNPFGIWVRRAAMGKASAEGSCAFGKIPNRRRDACG